MWKSRTLATPLRDENGKWSRPGSARLWNGTLEYDMTRMLKVYVHIYVFYSLGARITTAAAWVDSYTHTHTYERRRRVSEFRWENLPTPFCDDVTDAGCFIDYPGADVWSTTPFGDGPEAAFRYTFSSFSFSSPPLLSFQRKILTWSQRAWELKPLWLAAAQFEVFPFGFNLYRNASSRFFCSAAAAAVDADAWRKFKSTENGVIQNQNLFSKLDGWCREWEKLRIFYSRKLPAREKAAETLEIILINAFTMEFIALVSSCSFIQRAEKKESFGDYHKACPKLHEK